MNTGSRNALNVLGERDKVTKGGASGRARLDNLRNFLRAVPSLNFSERGRANICRRFNCDEAELAVAVANLQGPHPNAPTPKLLRTIGAAVGGPQSSGKEVAVC